MGSPLAEVLNNRRFLRQSAHRIIRQNEELGLKELQRLREWMLRHGWTEKECFLGQGSLTLEADGWMVVTMLNVVTLAWVPRIGGNPGKEDERFLLTIEAMGDFSPELKEAMKEGVSRFNERLWHTSMPGAKKERKSVSDEYVSSTPVFGKRETGKRK